MSIKSVITTTAIVSVLSVSAFAASMKKEEKMAAPAAMDSKMAPATAPAATTTAAPAAMDSKMAPATAPAAPMKAAK